MIADEVITVAAAIMAAMAVDGVVSLFLPAEMRAFQRIGGYAS
jgi:hypothetical protein